MRWTDIPSTEFKSEPEDIYRREKAGIYPLCARHEALTSQVIAKKCTKVFGLGKNPLCGEPFAPEVRPNSREGFLVIEKWPDQSYSKDTFRGAFSGRVIK